MPQTVSDMLTSLTAWMKEDVASALGLDAINDASESLFASLVSFSLQDFLGLPVNLSFANSQERAYLTSLPDPTLLNPVVTGVVAGAYPQRLCKFAITYVTESGSETLPSATVNFVVPINNVAHVASPPVQSGGLDWSKAFGYNVYAADQTWGVLFRVNTDPIPIGLDWQEDAVTPMFAISAAGMQEIPGDGILIPTENGTGDNIAFIEHMEVQTPDSTWKAWNQADLDSDLMRRYSHNLQSSSPYAAYAWDLVNMNRVEVRPALGAALTPRFFPVVKPRRLAYASAALPFGGIEGSVAFIRYFSMSLLKLAEEEYQAHSAWNTRAEQERNRILAARVKGGRARNNIITPYLR